MTIDPRFAPLLWALGFVSPVLASVSAVLFYIRHCRRHPNPQDRISVAAYISMVLVCAIIAFAIGWQFGIKWACSSGAAGNLCGLVGIFIIAPISAALAIFAVGASTLLLRGEPTSRAETWTVSSVCLKLWRGQYPLGRSFWGFFILGICIVWIVGLLGGFLFILYPPTLLVFRLLFLGYLAIAAVGVWRSADGSVRPSGTSIARAKAIAARAAVIVVVLTLTVGGKIERVLHALY